MQDAKTTLNFASIISAFLVLNNNFIDKYHCPTTYDISINPSNHGNYCFRDCPLYLFTLYLF